ncbi:MAG: RNA polymerase sigma factor, partial [Planctomycetota bacterium]
MPASPQSVRETLRCWFERHADDLFVFIHQRIGRADVSEDLVQETFVAAARWLEKGEPVETPMALLQTIARRRLVDYFRNERRRENAIAELNKVKHCEFSQSLNDPDLLRCDPEHLRSAIDRCVQQLSPTMRQVFRLRVIQQCEPKEVADLLDINQNSVAARLYRARMAVRDCL